MPGSPSADRVLANGDGKREHLGGRAARDVAPVALAGDRSSITGETAGAAPTPFGQLKPGNRVVLLAQPLRQ